MANIIGIDLGTATTLMATLNAAGQADIIRNDEGDNLTHSAVLFEADNRVVVGKQAKRLLGLAEEGRIFVEYKRDMHDHSVVHTVDGKEWTPRSFSSLVLKKLRKQLENEAKNPDAVIITIPANFMDEARVNTLQAARDAGFNLKDDDLINEPTAAALYYVTRSGASIQGKCLVYDFGGGTFDATILEVKGNDIRVLTSEGVQHLGGKDLDNKLLEIISRKFTAQTGAPFDAKALMVTKWDLEQEYKHPLSIRDKVDVVIRSPDHGSVRLNVTRAEFEEAISSLIAQANMAVENALDNAKLTTSDIDHVFLAGGSTRVPAVAASVEKLMGKKPFSDNPDEAVAKGAAIYAGIRNKSLLGTGQQAALAAKKVTDVTPHFYGTIIQQEGNRRANAILIRKDEPLPASKTETFYRGPEHGNRIRVQITQSAQATEDIDLVKVALDEWWRGLPEVGQSSEIIVTYSYNLGGIVDCEFVDKASGQVFRRTLSASGDTQGKQVDKGNAPGGNIDDILL